MANRRFCQLAAVALAAATPVLSHAVVFQSGVDPAANKAAPTGSLNGVSLSNSGWQWQANYFGGMTATIVGPNHLLTAKHIGGSVGSVFNPDGLGNVTITAVNDYGDDLRLITVNRTFHSYAPLYSASDEMNKYMVIHGRGGPRSNTTVHADQNPAKPALGWEWNTNPANGPFTNGTHYWDGALRWGANKTGAITGTQAHPGTLLAFDFTRNGDGVTGANEAGVVGGDSGGGLLISVNGEWRLAGVNFTVDTFRYTAGGPTLFATLYDSRGLFTSSGVPITDQGSDKPSSAYASRVSSFLAQLNGVMNLPPTWTSSGGGSWSTSSNWRNGTPANTAGATVDFRTSIQSDSTISLTSAQTLGTMSFDNTRRYTLSGSTINFDTTSGATPARINVASGSHTIASNVTLNNNLDVHVIQPASTLTVSGALTATGRTINKTGGGSVEFKNVRASTLNVQDGKIKILSDGSTAGTSKVDTLTVAGGKTLDLTNNDIVVTNGTLGSHTGGSNYSGLTGLVDSGRGNGSWNGTGITSSLAGATAGRHGLGIAAASDVLGISGSQTATWSGQTVTADSVLIKYTHVGDLDLNGRIDADDYWRIDAGYASNAKGYARGDLDYNGVIDGDDYFVIDQNYSGQGGVVLGQPASIGVTSVPEPSALAVACVFAAGCLMRRRARRS